GVCGEDGGPLILSRRVSGESKDPGRDPVRRISFRAPRSPTLGLQRGLVVILCSWYVLGSLFDMVNYDGVVSRMRVRGRETHKIWAGGLLITCIYRSTHQI